MLDDLLDGGLIECRFDGRFVETCILELAWNQMALGNLNLLFCDITAHLDDFHTVEQGLGDGTQIIGCGNEEHLG